MNQIKLIKIASFFSSLAFWNSIWLVYYLIYMSNKQIGIIEALVFFISQITEIPTGIFGDRYGWRRSLMIGYFILALVNLLIAFAPSYYTILFGACLAGIGTSFNSGSVESLEYSVAKVNNYNYANLQKSIKKYEYLGLLIATIIGGFLYNYDNRLPFILTGGISYLGTVILLYFIKEVRAENLEITQTNKLDLKISEKLKKFYKNATELLKNENLFAISIILIIGYCFTQYLNDFSLIRIGFDVTFLTIISVMNSIFTIIYFHYHDKFKLLSNYKYPIYLLCLITKIVDFKIVIFITSLLIPALYEEMLNESNRIILKNSTTQNSATNISTISFLRGIVYTFGIFIIGGLLDNGYFKTIVVSLCIVYTLGYLLMIRKEL